MKFLQSGEIKNKKQIFTQKKLVLIDWDGTIRKGFTLQDWMEFLYHHNEIHYKYVKNIENLFKMYRLKNISHDELAEQTASVYASALKNKKKDKIIKLSERFVNNYDKNHIYKFADPLFKFLIKINLEIIIVSGAPYEILLHYGKIFGFNRIFSLELETFNKTYTGRIKSNFGISREKKKIRVALEKNFLIFMGIGNSSSDIPLLNNTMISVIINNQSLKNKVNSKKVFCINCRTGKDDIDLKDFNEVIKEIKKLNLTTPSESQEYGEI